MEFTITFVKLFSLFIYLVLPILFFLTLIIVILGQIVCRIEKWKNFDALYWSLITATTVGYGDISPLKKSSKMISVVIALTGLMVTGIIIAITLSATQFAIEKHADKTVIENIKSAVE